MSTVNLANYLSKVPDLSLDNYDAWQNKIKLVLQLAQLDTYLTLPVVASTSDADKSMSKCVLAFIKLSCTDLVGNRILKTQYASEAWSYLANFYKGNSLLFHDDLTVQLRQLQQLPIEDCATYFDRAEVLFQKMLRADMVVSEHELVRNIMAGLRPEFTTAKQTLLLRFEALTLSETLRAFRLIEASNSTARAVSSSSQDAPQAFHAQKHSKPRHNQSTRGKPTGDAEDSQQSGLENAPPAERNKQHQGQKPNRQQAAGDQSQAPRFAFVAALSAVATSTDNVFHWVFDSGASRHMSPSRDDFISYAACDINVTLGSGVTKAIGVGSVQLWSVGPNGRPMAFILEDVLHVPGLALRLFSASQALERHYARAVLADGKCTFYVTLDSGVEIVLFTTYSHNALMVLDVYPSKTACKAAIRAANVSSFSVHSDAQMSSALPKTVTVSAESDDVPPPPVSNAPCTSDSDVACNSSIVAHADFAAKMPQNAHVNAFSCNASPELMRFDNAVHITDDGTNTDRNAHTHAVSSAENTSHAHCVLGDPRRLPFSFSYDSQSPLQIIHMDLCGPLKVPSVGGAFYMATFVDDTSRFAVVRTFATISDAPSVVQSVIASLESQTGSTLQSVYTDRGGEYLTAGLESYFASKAVRHLTTRPNPTQQFGVAEHFSRTLVNTVQSMLTHSGVPSPYWAEAAQAACTLCNVTSAHPGSSSPWELLFRHKPRLSGVPVFGCSAFITDAKVRKRKVDPPEPIAGISLGHSLQPKGYRILILDSKQVAVTRNVRFARAHFPLSGQVLDPIPEQVFHADSNLPLQSVISAVPAAPPLAVPLPRCSAVPSAAMPPTVPPRLESVVISSAANDLVVLAEPPVSPRAAAPPTMAVNATPPISPTRKKRRKPSPILACAKHRSAGG